MKIDVIIPVYKPDDRLQMIVDRLVRQTCYISRIILVYTCDDIDASDSEVLEVNANHMDRRVKSTANKVHNFDGHLGDKERILELKINKKDFDHGATRNKAIRHSDAEIFICMTQDAMPKNAYMIEHLIEGFATKDVVMAYARQIPYSNADIIESFARKHNYPNVSSVKCIKDYTSLGIKTIFASNVCCAYRRDIFEKLGGFEEELIFNEDMLYAYKVVEAGYKIAYVADSCVLHSHNYSIPMQFRRNYDIGVSHSSNADIFSRFSSEKEGKQMVIQNIQLLIDEGLGKKIPHYIVITMAKYLGYRLGKLSKVTPRKWNRLMSMNREYWDR